MRQLLGFFIILSLTAITLCGVMACLEFLPHYGVLASSVPLQPLMLVMIAGLFLTTTTILTTPAPTLRLRTHRDEIVPDPGIWRPLQLAFSDGILNTKAF